MGDDRMAAISRLDHALGTVRRFWSLPTLGRVQLDRAGIGSHRMGTYRVLRALASVDTAMSISDVAAVLRVEVSTASRMIDQAVTAGFVERGSDPRDGRRITVTLSEEGRNVDRQLSETRGAILGELTAGWDRDDLATLAALLDRLITEADRFGK